MQSINFHFIMTTILFNLTSYSMAGYIRSQKEVIFDAEFESEVHFDVMRHLASLFDADVKKNLEARLLHDKLCSYLETAGQYRRSKEWQSLTCFDSKKVPENQVAEFIEWQNRREVVLKFFDYCDFLQKVAFRSHSENQTDALKNIAIRPEFEFGEGGQMPIGDAMREIVAAYRQFFPSKFAKLTKKLPLQSNNLQELRKGIFKNRDNCTKVLAWVYVLLKSDYSQKQEAERVLTEVRQFQLGNSPDMPKLLFPPAPVQVDMQKNGVQKKAPTNKPQRNNGSKDTTKSNLSNGTRRSNYGYGYRGEPSRERDTFVDDLYDAWMFQMMVDSISDMKSNSSAASSSSGAIPAQGGDSCCTCSCHETASFPDCPSPTCPDCPSCDCDCKCDDCCDDCDGEALGQCLLCICCCPCYVLANCDGDLNFD